MVRVPVQSPQPVPRNRAVDGCVCGSAGPGDLPQLIDFAGGLGLTARGLLRAVEASQLFVARYEGRIAAAALFSRDDDGPRLERVFTRPDLRRRGLGSCLVRTCVASAQVEGVQGRVTAAAPLAQPGLCRFLVACGLVPCPKTETRGGVEVVRFDYYFDEPLRTP